MPGNAILNPRNLVDGLVGTVDRLRSSLQEPFGIRPFRMFRIIRTWDGTMQGEGEYIDEIAEITTRPRVRQWDGYKWVLLAQGSHEDGHVMVDEVSLSYTHPELTGGELGKNQQLFFLLKDAYGNLNEDRILRLAKPPFIDREKTMGWVLTLMDMNIQDDAKPVVL